jgi:hypothetical protein
VADPTKKKPPPRMLHFFPGTKRLYYFVDGKPVKETEAWGGPAGTVKGDIMDQGPTDPGDYIIYSVEPYRTNTWPMSRLKWGTKLRANGDKVMFEESPGRWLPLEKRVPGIGAKDLADENFRLYGQRKLPDRWVFNDFGPLAIRYFKDKNKDGKKDANEPLSGEMFHTTPDDEAATALGKKVNLMPSHGCIHLKPMDRDDLISLGAFKRGTPLKIHEYSEHVRITIGESSP